jgi:hypothetical protein
MYVMTRKEKAATKVWNATIIVASSPNRIANFLVEKTSKHVNYSK